MTCAAGLADGVRLVNVYVPGQHSSNAGKPGGNSHKWGDHAANWNMDHALRLRLPWFDACAANMIEDLHARGLDKNTLLVVTGEFGRTPRLESVNGSVGRDHWPGAMSVLVSGGGLDRGNVIGATDKRGAAPVGFKHDPFDFLATIYHWLGIDPAQNVLDLSGRPVPLSPGAPIRGMVWPHRGPRNGPAGRRGTGGRAARPRECSRSYAAPNAVFRPGTRTGRRRLGAASNAETAGGAACGSTPTWAGEVPMLAAEINGRLKSGPPERGIDSGRRTRLSPRGGIGRHQLISDIGGSGSSGASRAATVSNSTGRRSMPEAWCRFTARGRLDRRRRSRPVLVSRAR